MPKIISIPLISSLGKAYVIDFSIQEAWIGYWQQAEPPVLEVLQALITQVINQAYIDNPEYKQTIQTVTIYRPNHDAGHALRAWTLVEFIARIMQQCGTPEIQATLAQLTHEEWQITLLASFLYRAGRTNEDSSLSGLSQNDRSAKLFYAIATGLGFSARLATTLAACIENYAPVNDTEKLKNIHLHCDQSMNLDKLKLINGLLLLSHNSDLVRCWSNLHDIQVNNLDNLTAFFPQAHVSGINHCVILFAKTLCQWTGTDFYDHEQQNESRRCAPAIYKAQCVVNIAAVAGRLDAIMTAWLSALPDLEIDTINEYYQSTLKLELPNNYKTQIRADIEQRAIEAQENYTNITGIHPYEQSKQSIAHLSKLVGELTAEENPIYQYLTLEFPWTIKHGTQHFNEVITSGYIYSTAELRRLGVPRSRTLADHGTQHYVFLTMGNVESKGTRVFGSVDTFATSYRELIEDNPFVINSSLIYSHILQRCSELLIFKHAIKIECFVRDKDRPHTTAYKIVTITQPNGQTHKIEIDFKNEIVAGADIIQHHSLYIVYLLRYFDVPTRELLLTNPHADELQELVNFVSGISNYEMLLPGKLNVHDHHIEYLQSEKQEQQHQAELQKLKEALNSYEDKQLQELLDNGMSPDFEMEHGLSPLGTLLYYSNQDFLFSKMILLVRAGASVTLCINNHTLFSRAIATKNLALVTAILDRKDKGDVVTINTDTMAIATAIYQNDNPLLDLLEQYGLNYSRLDYGIFKLLLDYPDMTCMAIIKRLKSSQFDFTKQSKRNIDLSIEIITGLLQRQKIRLLGELLSIGLLKIAEQSHLFSTELQYRLREHELYTVPKVKAQTGSVHVQVFLKTEAQEVLLIRAQYDRQPVPYWHGITGAITTEINEASITQFCLVQINWRPQIKSFDVIVSDAEQVIIVNLKSGAVPLVFNTQFVATGKCQSTEQWAREKLAITDLAKTVLSAGNIIAAIIRQTQLPASIAANDLTLANQGVYHPNQSALVKLLDAPRPNFLTLTSLVQLGYSLKVTTQYQNQEISLLMLAVLHRHLQLQDKLIELGADVYQRVGYQGLTVIHFAMQIANLPALQRLHEQGYDFKHSSLRDLSAFVKKHAIAKNIQAFLIKINALTPEKSEESKLLDTHLKFTDLYTWLIYAGLDKKTDIEQRIEREYQITYFVTQPVLKLFEQQLKQQGMLPANIRLALAEVGFHPVFECMGLSQPVIAISKEFLMMDKVAVVDVVIGIAMSVLAWKKRQNNEFVFQDLSIDDLEMIDNMLVNEGGYSFDQLKNYLQLASILQNTTADCEYFKWPNRLTNPYSERTIPITYPDRIKLFLKSINLNQAKSNKDFCLSITSDIQQIKNAVNLIPEINCFPDFPMEGKISKKRTWFVKNLVHLHDELLAWECCELPSLAMKQYANLLVKNSGQLRDDQVNEILRLAFDRQIYSYAYLHARVNGLTIFQEYQSDQHRYGGYFKDMWLAAKGFCEATDIASAKKYASTLMKTYPILFPILLDWNASDILYEGFDKSAVPKRQWIVRQPNYYLPSENTLKLPNEFDAWIVHEHQDTGQVGPIWRAHWLLGLWNGRHCNWLPEFIWQNSLNSYDQFQRKALTSPSVVLPRLYEHKAAAHYGDMLKKWRVKGKKLPTIAENASQIEIRNFAEAHKEKLVTSERKSSSLNDTQRSFIRALKTQEQTADGRAFIKYLLLGNWLYNQSGDREAFAEYVIDATFYSKDEKIAFWKRYQIGVHSSRNYLIDIFQDHDDFILEVLPYIQIVDTISMNKICECFNSQIQAFNLFNPKLLSILDYLQAHFYRPFKIAAYWLDKVVWQHPKHCKLPVMDLIRLYRLLDTMHAFHSWEEYVELREEILKKVNQLAYFDELQFAALLLLQIDDKYSPLRIADEILLQKVLDYFAQRAIKELGHDDGSTEFAATVKLLLVKLNPKLSGNDFQELSEKIMHGILAQPFLSHWFETSYATEALSTGGLVCLIKAMNVIGEDQKDKYDFLNFLVADILSQDLNKFVKRIMRSHRLSDIISKFFDTTLLLTDVQYYFWLRILHQTFWSLTIAQRAFVVDSLICPSHIERSEQEKLACYEQNLEFILQKLLGAQLNSERDRCAYSLIKCFLAAASSYERQFLLSALISATKQTDTQSSLGCKLAVLFSNMGPAYIKLGQALHSHPDTPEDIRKDLSKMKSDVAIPPRWTLIAYIEKTLPDPLYQNIAFFGEILGSASYHIAVKTRTLDNAELVLLLTRPDAEELASKGFAHLKRTAELFNDPQFVRYQAMGQDILTHAEAMSLCELDNVVGDQQHAMAATIYNKPAFTLSYQDLQYSIHLKACRSHVSGPKYRMLEHMEGTSFNKLATNTLQKKVAALAMMKFELTQILSGNQFDCDRHGEQAKFKFVNNKIHIGLFDFGEMGITAITANQRAGIIGFLRELPRAIGRGQNMFELMQQHIQRTSDAEIKNHLMRTQKAVLALSDYLRELEPEIPVVNLIKDILPAIHPEYRSALIEGYRPTSATGWFQFFANSVADAMSNQISHLFYGPSNK